MIDLAMLSERFTFGGAEHAFAAGPPLGDDVVDAAARTIGWPLPDDYREFLVSQGTADVYGARILHPDEWGARSEPQSNDPVGPMANILPFARKVIPGGGEMLFCFRFDLPLRTMAPEMSAFAEGEARPTFLGAPYQVFACHLEKPTGKLANAGRPIAPTFTAWLGQIVAMLRMKANAAR